MASWVEELEEGWRGSERKCEETDAGMLLEQMPGPNSKVTNADEECCATDDLSDTQEPFHEAWVVRERLSDEGSSEEDHSDLHTDTNPSQPYLPFHYEQEDWDAELLQNENPYDEEDLVDMSCGERISPIDDTLLNESSYLPSLHHVAPVTLREACNALHVKYEAGQFEDAEL